MLPRRCYQNAEDAQSPKAVREVSQGAQGLSETTRLHKKTGQQGRGEIKNRPTMGSNKAQNTAQPLGFFQFF